MPEVRRHAAITDPQALGGLLRAIHGYRGYFAVVAALKLAPLVCVRPVELRTAEWQQFDLDAAEWSIPGARMKMDNDHIVPLARQAVDLLRALRPLCGNSVFVFPGRRSGQVCMSDSAMNAALRAMGYPKEMMVVEGFRASARTLLDEGLRERAGLIEQQLAYALSAASGTAYNRASRLADRRAMMQRWANYLDDLRLRAKPIASHG